MRPWLLLILAVLQIAAAPVLEGTAAAPSPPVRPAEAPVHTISLITLLGNPERYDGQLVRVTGFLRFEFEGDALYVSKQDFEAFINKNAVWIDGPKLENEPVRRRLDRHYATVVGRFDAHSYGHLGSYAGSIMDVSRIDREPTYRELTMINRFDPYTIHLPWPVVIPWPLILGLLYLWVAGLLVAVGRKRGGAGLTAPGFGGTLRWLVLLLTAFTAVRALGGVTYLWIWTRHWIRADAHLYLNLIEAGVGLAAMAGMWFFLRRKRPVVCLMACVVQLLVPTVVEAIRYDGLLSPASSSSSWSGEAAWIRPVSQLNGRAAPVSEH